ncbi:integrase [Edwardsiella tarda]
MHRIDTPTAQKDKFGARKNGFTRGNPQTGTPSTDLDDDYFDSLQEEIVGVIEAAAITLDKSDRGQLLKAMKKHFQTSDKTLTALAGLLTGANKLPYFTGNYTADQTDLTQVGRDIIGKTTVAAVLEYLGLRDAIKQMTYGCPLIGTCISWCNERMPQEIWPDCGMEFIPWMAQSFDPVKYPLAHQLWPNDRLPVDMRGEFVRGWDNGRGVDPGRNLLSSQSDSVKRHRHATAFTTTISDSRYPAGAATIVVSGDSSNVSFMSNDLTSTRYVGTFDGSEEGQTQNESRPRSVAWNMIVRVK